MMKSIRASKKYIYTIFYFNNRLLKLNIKRPITVH